MNSVHSRGLLQNFNPSLDYHPDQYDAQKLNFPTLFQKTAYGDNGSILLFRSNNVSNDEAMNQIDLWRDGRTAYIDILDDDGKPGVFNYNLKDDDYSPHGYRYGPYMKVFTGYADRQGEWADFYMEDASHYTATNSKDMKYTVHAQVGFLPVNIRSFASDVSKWHLKTIKESLLW